MPSETSQILLESLHVVGRKDSQKERCLVGIFVETMDGILQREQESTASFYALLLPWPTWKGC